jgi:hypothetical protein
MIKPIDGLQPVCHYHKPIPYLFRGKLNCYTDQKAVTQSILLVDFDHGAAVENIGGESRVAPTISNLMF